MHARACVYWVKMCMFACVKELDAYSQKIVFHTFSREKKSTWHVINIRNKLKTYIGKRLFELRANADHLKRWTALLIEERKFSIYCTHNDTYKQTTHEQICTHLTHTSVHTNTYMYTHGTHNQKYQMRTLWGSCIHKMWIKRGIRKQAYEKKYFTFTPVVDERDSCGLVWWLKNKKKKF